MIYLIFTWNKICENDMRDNFKEKIILHHMLIYQPGIFWYFPNELKKNIALEILRRFSRYISLIPSMRSWVLILSNQLNIRVWHDVRGKGRDGDLLIPGFHWIINVSELMSSKSYERFFLKILGRKLINQETFFNLWPPE